MIKAKQKLAGASCAALFVAMAWVMPASAQNLSQLSCNDLWYERNNIFHDYGYCFKTQRGKINYSNQGCYHNTSQAALNDMPQAKRRQIDRIRAEERRRGC